MRELKLIESSSFHPSRSESIPVIEQYDVRIQSEYLTFLYKVLASSQKLESHTEGINMLLASGLKRLDADFALVVRPVSTEVGQVVAFSGADESFYIGQHIAIGDSFCNHVLSKKETCVYTNVSTEDVKLSTAAYNGVEVGAYQGTIVESQNADPAILCFISSQPKVGETPAEDVFILELLAEGVAFMVDLQKAHAQRKLTDQAMFALGSVKTLDEYLEQARIPEVFGVPARVVEVLERRVGHAALSIGHVAEELNLSKRTLQRRLQQQDISFAELRDQVRFHYAIDFLIKQHLSIDSISASLDFSDRTSFTNAFKRWTGLSPSTFRKLFRDYV